MFNHSYPYTDNHELNLDWILERIKVNTDEWNTFRDALNASWEEYKAGLNHEWDTVEAAWQTMKTFVETFFENLDVQEEVNAKINELVSDGTILNLIKTYIGPFNFKGAVQTINDLPDSGTLNDTYYIEELKYRVTWTGEAWEQSSLDEADYLDELSELKRDLNEDTNKLWKDFPYTKGYYLNVYGGFSTRESSYITDYIPVKVGQKIQVSGYAGVSAGLYAFYSDKYAINMISIYVPDTYGRHTQIVEVPEGAKYVVASSFVDTDRFFMRTIYDYDDLIEQDASNDKPKYGHHLKKPFDFKNKTSVWFGDSITAGVTSPNLVVTNENYPTLFASYAGAAAIFNKAVSGSCITDPDDQYSILNQILNYSNAAKDFTFISGGTNDYSTGKPVGTFGDTTADTLYGALYLICEHLKSNDRFANSTIIFITPINQNKNRDNPRAIESINAYRDAIYEVTTSYGFNVVDGLQIGFPIESGGFADELCTDGVHPTQKGHEYYAKALCGILI